MKINLEDAVKVGDVSKVKTATTESTQYTTTDSITIELSKPIDVKKLTDAYGDCG